MSNALSILLIDNQSESNLKELLQKSGHSILSHGSIDEELFYKLAAQSEIGCIVISSALLNDATTDIRDKAREVLQDVRKVHPLLPIFFDGDMHVEDGYEIDEKLDIRKQHPEQTLNHIETCISQYQQKSSTPYFDALQKYVDKNKYSWHTPGHNGGDAFLHTPIGRRFYDFYGSNAFKSDLSASVPELGSLLDHTSPVKEAEENAARTFGANRTYFVTNGTSTANKIVWHAIVNRDDKVLVDRNCHKSLIHAIIMTGANPTYLMPTRNKYGIMGPVPLSEFENQPNDIRLAVITNSTYDGLCYRVRSIFNKLKAKTDAIHFDEAWFAYAKFNNFYKGCFAMGIDRGKGAPALFATHSTHKVLAAFSQASMIHVSAGQADKLRFDHERFNEAFMMHTSTSPQYGIVASLDVAAGIIDSGPGKLQLNETIHNAIKFRHLVNRSFAETDDPNTWFFKVWQPETTQRGDAFGAMLEQYVSNRYAIETGKQTDLLNPEDWLLKPGDKWHGFTLTPNEHHYVLLDPTKVTVLTPGLNKSECFNIPAAIVSEYMRERGIVVEKTGLYSFLVLYTMGATDDKVNQTIEVMKQFRADYENNTNNLRRDCERMQASLERYNIAGLMNDIYKELPPQSKMPWEAYKYLVSGSVKKVEISSLTPKHVVAVQLTPYPPGIPLMMPGENFTQDIIDYLNFCHKFDKAHPGYETEIHGLVLKGENRYVLCLE